MSKAIKKHITFPSSMFHLAEMRARQFGVSVAEYVRYLVMNDTSSLLNQQKQDDLAGFEQLATKSFSFWDNEQDDIYQSFYENQNEKK